MDNVSSRAQDIFLRLQDPGEALGLMGYRGRMQNIINDAHSTVEEKVFRTMTSELFRSISLPAENQAYVRSKIHQAFERKEELTIILPFGAYKTHYSYSYPLPNFAEIFNILYMRALAYLLHKVYPFGVRILYIADLRDHVSEVTGIPLVSLEKYHHSYEELFHHFVQPNDSLFYMGNEALQAKLSVSSDAIKDAVLERIASHAEPLPDEVLFPLLSSTYIAGFASTSTTELLTHIRKTYLYHKYYVGCIDDELFKIFPNAILISAKKKIPHFLASVKCFYNSPVQFWVGDGVFVQQNKKLFSTIASKNQVRSFHFVDFANVHDQQLFKSNNYLRHVPVYEKTSN